LALLTSAVVASVALPAAASPTPAKAAPDAPAGQPAVPVSKPAAPAPNPNPNPKGVGQQGVDPGVMAPPTGLTRKGGRQVGPASKTQVPAFSLLVNQFSPARSGSTGRVDVNIARNGMPGVNAKDLTVVISAPRGSTVVSAATEPSRRPEAADLRGGWSCSATASGGQRCKYSGDLRSGHVPVPIRAKLTAPPIPVERARKLHVLASLSWTEDRVADDHDGVSGSDPVVGSRQQRVPGGGWLSVDPPVTVALHGFGDGVTNVDPNGPVESRIGHLAGRIGNIDDRSVRVSWTQIAGPAVRFRQPVARSHVTTQVSQSYEVPEHIADGTKLGFRLTASGPGWARSADTTVTVRSLQVGRFNPRLEQLKSALAASAEPRPARRGLSVPRSSYATGIGSRGTQRVGPGGQVRLTFYHPRGVTSVAWSAVTPGAAGLVAKARRVGNDLIFTAPSRAQTLIVRGVAVLRDGRKISRTKLVKVEAKVTPVRHPRRPAGRSAATSAAAAAAPAGPAADAKSTAMFCALKAGSKVAFLDGSSLLLPASYAAPAGCGNTSSASFTGASLTYNGTAFGSVAGTISGNGVTIANVTLAVPANLRPYLPSTYSGTTLTLTAPANPAVGALFVNGTAQGFSGTFTSNTALSFFPVPAGWTAPAMTATLSYVAGAPSLQLLVSANATDGSNGSASFTVNLAGGGASNVVVNASDIALLQSTSGDQLDATVTGTFSLSAPNTLAATLSCPAPSASGCQLATGFWLANNTTMMWTSGAKGGLALTHAGVTVGAGSSTYKFNVSGAYNGTGNWKFTVDSGASDWQFGSTGVALTNFTGTVAETPAAAPSAGTAATSSTFTVTVSSQVTGVTMESWLGTPKLTGSIGNTCPAGVPADQCSAGNVVVSVAAAGNATVLGAQVPYTANSIVNLSTWALAFDATASYAPAGGFGPSELNVKTITLTFQGAPGSMSLGIAANGSALGSDNVALTGKLGSDGYYLAGNVRSFSQGGFTAGSGGVSFGYSSYDTSVTLPGTKTPTKLVATTITVTGSYAVPASVTSALGLPAGTATFTSQLNVTKDTFAATVDFQLSNPTILVGSANSTNLTFDEVSLTITASTTSVSFSAAVVGALNTVATGNTAASTTPIAGSIGITLGGPGGASIDVEVGVDTAQLAPTTCTDGNKADVCTAFGVNGLDVNTLAISGSYAAGSPSLSFNADAFLPSSWTTNLLVGSPEIKLGFDISLSTPCITFKVGTPTGDTNVIDIGGGGAITATYLHLLFAPAGCTLPSGNTAGTTIAPGLALNFDGAILDTPTQVNLAMGIESDGVAITGNLNIGAFTLAGASVQQTQLSFDINTSPTAGLIYKVSFSGGVLVGTGSVGGSAQVTGSFDIQPGTLEVNLAGSGNLNLGPLSASLTGFYFNIDYNNGSLVSLAVGGNLSTTVLGVSLQGSVGLTYADSTLLQFHMGMGATIDFYVGSVSGAVTLDYCNGTLGAEPTNAQSCSVNLSGYGGQTNFEVYFDGSFSVGVCPHDHWYDVCYSKSFSDSVVDTSWNNPAPPPPPQPGQPGAPTGVAGTKQATVSWSPPSYAGTSPISSYNLQQSIDGGTTWTDTSSQPKGTATSILLKGLTDGTSYLFRVEARNGSGAGSQSGSSAVVVPYAPQPVQANLDLANPGNPAQFSTTSAGDYNLDLMWAKASTIGNLVSSDGTTTNTVMVSAVAPTSYPSSTGTVPACTSPQVGFASDAPDKAPTNVEPITSTCAIQVVYSTLQSSWNGLNGVVPAADFSDPSNPGANLVALGNLADNGQSAQAWNTAAAGFAICYPSTAGGSQGAHCELLGAPTPPNQSGADLGAVQSPIASNGYVAPFTQLLNGTINPIGVVPAGMAMPLNSATGVIWSPDGKSYLQGGSYTGGDGLGGVCPDGSQCGYLIAITGNTFPNTAVNDQTIEQLGVEFVVDSLPAPLQSLYVDPTSGAFLAQLTNGTTVNPFANQVNVQGGVAGRPYLFVEQGMRLFSGTNCAPADWTSQCGAPGATGPQPLWLVNGANPPCLTVASFTSGTPSQAANCSGSNIGQQVYFDETVFPENINLPSQQTHFTGGRIILGSPSPTANVGQPGQCLDVLNSGTSPGTVVDVATCQTTGIAANQTWVYNVDGSITNPTAAGLCLDSVASGVLLNTCSGAPTQQWTRQGASNTATSRSRPAPAVGVKAVPFDGSATVSWTPGSNNGSTITSTTVTALPGGQVCTAQAESSSCTVTGLTDGTAYSFTVIQNNDIGSSAPSRQSNSVTPLPVPGSPTAVTASLAAGTPNPNAVVAWKAPAANGGPQIAGYTATASSGQQCSTTGPLATSCLVTGIPRGLPVTFTVTAANTMGTSAKSQPSGTLQPVGVPYAPNSPYVTYSGDGQTSNPTVNWQAPVGNNGAQGDGGSAITEYSVTASPGGQTVCTATPNPGQNAYSCQPSGLLSGVQYSLSIVATNAVGDSPAVGPIPVTYQGAPASPTGVGAATVNGATVVSWTPVTVPTGGTPISSFQVTASPGGATCTAAGSASSCAVPGLASASSYAFTVTANNTFGPSAPSASINWTTSPAAGSPASPTLMNVTTDNVGTYYEPSFAIAATWTPGAAGASPITGFTVTAVDQDTNGQATCTAPAGATSCTIQAKIGYGNPFEVGDPISVTVTATNTNGTSAASGAQTVSLQR
jgi:hypothetical protein